MFPSVFHHALTLLLAFGLLWPATAAVVTNAPVRAPASPREFYNAGTEKLSEGKWREAEGFLQSAVASQDARVQPSALYNLGQVRAMQGDEALKKGPEPRRTSARGRAAAAGGEEAVHQADAALAQENVQKLVEAYLRGRGARRDLREAARAVRQTMETFATVLAKWQRASGDFKSAAELNPSDTNAVHNAEVMDRAIARLVDQLQQLMQAAMAMAEQNRKLGERMKQLQGRIPAPLMPPGAAGDEEEEEDNPFGPLPGQQEGPSRDGEERPMSPEEAGRLLDSFKLDGDRRLPMGQGEEAKPKDRSRSNW